MFGAQAAGGDEEKKPKEKSDRLLPWSTAPAQLLNACGSNHLSDADLPEFWRVLSQGNKAVKYFYEGVAADEVRQSVGASRAVGALEAFLVDVVSKEHLATILKPDVLKNIKTEAEELLPHLRTLNAAGVPTPGSQAKDDKGKLFKRQRTVGKIPEPQEIATAAAALFQWIQKKPSMLKFVILAFGADGLSHNAQVYEKCLRAHVSQQSLDMNGFVAMVRKRFEGVPASLSTGGASELTAFKS